MFRNSSINRPRTKFMWFWTAGCSSIISSCFYYLSMKKPQVCKFLRKYKLRRILEGAMRVRVTKEASTKVHTTNRLIMSTLMPCPSIGPKIFWTVQIVLDRFKLFWSCPNRFGWVQIILVRYELDFSGLFFIIWTYTNMPNKRACTFISGKVCPLTLI